MNLANQLPGDFVGVGSKFHIVEAFGADAKMLIDVTEEVIKLDEQGIRCVLKVISTKAGILSMKW